MDGHRTMSYEEPLSQRIVAISISDHPDMAPLGLAPEHLTDVMSEVARHLLALGARLMYGGDLRPDTDDEPGFTRILFELVSRHRRDADLGDDRPALVNVLAWPLHQSYVPPATVAEYQTELGGLVEFVTLGADGEPVPLHSLLGRTPGPPTDADWSSGLTTMREWSTKHTDARVVLGGRTEEYKGRMPGVAEEALTSIRHRKPVYVLGGFGGAARDVAALLGLRPNTPERRPVWPSADAFVGFDHRALQNGLSREENATLAQTPHVDEAITLILRGLLGPADGA